jgi:hypothetical protein
VAAVDFAAVQAKFNLGARVADANQRLAAAAAAAMRQDRQQQEQQQAAALMAQVANAAAGVLQSQSMPGMSMQMMLQQPQQAQEQAA